MSSPVSWEDYATGPSECAPEWSWAWEGLVGLWAPAIGPTGNALFDMSGRNNHGTLTNMAPAEDWVGSPYGWALDFDGVNDRIITEAALNTILPAGGPFTISVGLEFVRATTGNDQTILAARKLGKSGLLLKIDSANTDQLQLATWNGSTLQANVYGTKTDWVNGQYYHVSVAFDQAGYTFYVDGLIDNYTADADGFGDIDLPLTIGIADTSTECFIGKMSVIMLHNRSLSTEEIRAWSVDPLALLRPAGFGAELWYSGGAPPAGSSMPAIYDYYRRLRCA